MKNVFKSKKVMKTMILVMMVVIFSSNSVMVFANSNYREINKLIMSEDVKRGHADPVVYKTIERDINSLSNQYEKNALMLKLNTILNMYDINIDNVVIKPNTPDSNTDKPLNNDGLSNNSNLDLTNNDDFDNDHNSNDLINTTENGKDESKDDVEFSHSPLIKGYDDGKIRPDDFISREEAATIILRAVPTKKVNNKSKNFKDLKSNRWSYDSIMKVNVDGYHDGTFKPGGNITRAEALSMIDKNFDLKGLNKSKEKYSFKDVNKHWAKNTILKMSSLKVVNGYKDNTFRPDDYITRAEFITFINRAVRENCIIDKDVPAYQSVLALYFNEINKHWAKDILIEAIIPHN